jgi:hypothetical protein
MWKLESAQLINTLACWNLTARRPDDNPAHPNAGLGTKAYRLYATESSAGYAAGDPNDGSWGSPVSAGTLFHVSAIDPEKTPYEQRIPVGVTAQYVMMRCDSSYGRPYVGLMEIAFNLPAEPVINGKYPVVGAKVCGSYDNAGNTIDGNTANGAETLLDDVDTKGWWMWDLGETFNLTGMSIWNQNGWPPVKDFTLYFTDNASAFDPLEDYNHGGLTAGELALWGPSVFSGQLADNGSEQQFAFSATGRYALLKVNSVWAGVGQVWAGLREVKFAGSLPAAAPSAPSGTVILLR